MKPTKTEKCPKCGRFMEYDIEELEPHYHYICNKCDLFYCFEKGCHCCDGYEDETNKN